MIQKYNEVRNMGLIKEGLHALLDPDFCIIKEVLYEL